MVTIKSLIPLGLLFVLILATIPSVSAGTDDSLFDDIIDWVTELFDGNSEDIIQATESYEIREDDNGKTTLDLRDLNGYYIDESGEYNSISPGLVTDSITNIHKVESGRYQTYFEDGLDSEYIFSFQYGSVYMNFSAPIFTFNSKEQTLNLVKPSTNSNTIEYQEILKGVNLEYVYEETELKEYITITDESIFDGYTLTDLTTELENESTEYITDNSYLEIKYKYNSNTDITQYLTTPFIIDSEGAIYNIDYSIEQDYLILEIPYRIFANNNYPYIIDPTLTISATTTLGGIQNYDIIIVNAPINIAPYNGSENTGWLFLNASDYIAINNTNINGSGAGFYGGQEPGDVDGGTNGTCYPSNMYPIGTNANFTHGYGRGGFTYWAGNPQMVSGGSGASVIGNGTPYLYLDPYEWKGAGGFTGFGSKTNLSAYMGCGGGSSAGRIVTGNDGGNGGAGITLFATNYILVNGSTIQANGTKGLHGSGASVSAGSGGGGGGGSIIFNSTNLIFKNSIVSVSGGAGQSPKEDNPYWYKSGSGAGGKIVFSYLILDNATLTANASEGWAELESGYTSVTDLFGQEGLITYNSQGGVVTTKLTTPTNASNSGIQNIEFQCNSTSTVYNLNHVNLLIWNSTNYLISNTTNSTPLANGVVYFTKSLPRTGTYHWNCQGVNEIGIIGLATTNYTLNADIFNSVTYSVSSTKNSTSDGDIVRYSLSLLGTNIDSLYPDSNATFKFNNINYNDASKYLTTDNITFIKSLTMPYGTGTGAGNNISWNWTYTLFNSTTNPQRYNTSSWYTIIYGLDIDDCTDNSQQIFNFTLYDENDATTSNLSNESIEAYFYVYNLAHTNTLNFTVTSNTSNLSACASTGVLNSSQLFMDVIAKYSATDYAVEYYYLDNAELTNTTSYTIPLYDLIGTDATSFLVTYRNKVYLPIESAIIELQRFYVGDGVWRNVEWTKTDENGQGVLHYVTEDVRYRTYVRLDNILQFISSDGYAVCTATPCTLLIQDTVEFNAIDNLESIEDLAYTIEFDKEARRVNFDYTIITGENKNITMYTRRWDNRNNLTICSETQVASGGSMTCLIPTTASNTTYFVNVYKDNNIVISRFFSLTPYASETFGSIGLIMTIVIFLGLSLIGLALGSGIAIIIFGILGIIFSGLVMIIDTGNFIGVGSAVMWLIIAGVIVIFKISSRRSA